MKHANISEFRGAPVTTCRYVVIGDFAPDTSSNAANIVQTLHVKGGELVTMSCASPSFARLPLVFRTRRLFAKTCADLDAAISSDTRCIIYPSGLGINKINKPRWVSRRMEEWRRYRLAIAASRKSKHCTLMLEREGPYWLTAALVLSLLTLKPFDLRIKRASRLDSTTGTMQTVFALIGKPRKLCPEYFALRANATKLERTDQHSALAADLRLIYDINDYLRRSVKTFLHMNLTGGMSKAKIANHQSAHAGISQFMLHYNKTLLEPFPLNTPQKQKDFIAWYVRGPKPVTLPIPRSIAAKAFANMNAPMAHQAKPILELGHRIEDFSHLPAHVRAFFSMRMGNDPQNISRMELLCALHSGLKPINLTMFDTPWQADEIRRWYSDSICKSAPAMAIFSTGNSKPLKIPQTVMIKGVTDGQSGLARNAKMHAQALAGLDKTLLRSVTLHNTNADQIPQQIVSSSSDLHIGFLLWELEGIPKTHRLAGEMLDEIWVPSCYVQSIYETAYNRPVVNIGKGIHLPQLGKADMSPYGISPEHHMVLTCFDAHSSVERKNPLAAVQAFQQAFAGDPEARMFVKTTPVGKSHWGDPNHQMQRIKYLAKRDPRIIVESRMLPFHELLSLIDRADCVVSSHRAEGFGYIPAYALGYATPVIATDYSGTTDICTNKTAYPVKYAMRNVQQGESIAPVAAAWADIDRDGLVNAMREVFEDPASAQRKALVGQQLIRNKYAPAKQAKRYAERLEILGAI